VTATVACEHANLPLPCFSYLVPHISHPLVGFRLTSAGTGSPGLGCKSAYPGDLRKPLASACCVPAALYPRYCVSHVKALSPPSTTYCYTRGPTGAPVCCSTPVPARPWRAGGLPLAVPCITATPPATWVSTPILPHRSPKMHRTAVLSTSILPVTSQVALSIV
jgi:hypothetical protein